MKTLSKARRLRRQAGALSVEVALLFAFVLAPMLAGVVDFGQILLAQAMVTRAARQGALAASRDQDATQAVTRYLESAGYDTARMSVTTTGTGVSGTPITVSVRYDTSGMVIIPWGSMSPDMEAVVGSATERKS